MIFVDGVKHVIYLVYLAMIGNCVVRFIFCHILLKLIAVLVQALLFSMLKFGDFLYC